MKKLISAILVVLLIFSSNAVVFASSGSVTGLGEDQNDIDVNAVYSTSITTSDVVSVDISWGAMEFTYSVAGSKTWDPATHAYIENTSGSWSASGNDITVTNHSNVAVEAELSFTATAAGITGQFDESSGTANDNVLSLASAENTAVTNAPSATATFNIIGGKVDSTGKVGTITVLISKAPIVIAQLGTDTAYDLYSTSQAGVYTATIQWNNDLTSSSYTSNFVYDPAQFINAGIAEVDAKVESDSTIKGFILESNGSIVTTVSEEDPQMIRLTNDSFYLLTLDFINMTWSVEEIVE